MEKNFWICFVCGVDSQKIKTQQVFFFSSATVFSGFSYLFYFVFLCCQQRCKFNLLTTLFSSAFFSVLFCLTIFFQFPFVTFEAYITFSLQLPIIVSFMEVRFLGLFRELYLNFFFPLAEISTLKCFLKIYVSFIFI